MIKNLDNDKEQEFNLIEKNLKSIQEKFFINNELVDSYLNDLKWILDHIDCESISIIKRLNKINSELIHHINGFDILITNQNDLSFKKDLIQSFEKQIELSNSILKEIQLVL